MTSAVRLRKTLLKIVRQILHDLEGSGTPCLVTTRVPFRVPAGATLRELPVPPLDEADARRSYPEGLRWDAVHLQALNYPALSCIVEGEADILAGVTTAMLSQVAPRDRPVDPRGAYLISAAAPAYILVPPGVPGRTGDIVPWDRDEPHAGTMLIFKARVLPVGALCHFATLQDGVFNVRYSLLVKDDQLESIMDILLNEESGREPDPRISHAQMLTLMLRIERALSSQPPLMTDGLYSRFPANTPEEDAALSIHQPSIRRAHNYIQLHLHEALTPASIAAYMRMTPAHLNRVFKINTGLSTMNYVAKLRLESAELLLRDSDLSVDEVCRLVGYRQLAHFSRSFRRHSGQSPLKFRQSRERTRP